jgi:C-terminal processing protease CtpA/Prc
MLRLCLLLFVLAAAFADAAFAQENRGYLGVELQNVTKEEADRLGWEAPRSARVVQPREGSPGAVAGILAHDIITSIDGQDVENAERLIASVSVRGTGAQVRLRLLRDGKERTLVVTLGRRPPDLAQMVETENADVPILQLDTQGHMGVIRALAFTPDNLSIVSADSSDTQRCSAAQPRPLSAKHLSRAHTLLRHAIRYPAIPMPFLTWPRTASA